MPDYQSIPDSWLTVGKATVQKIWQRIKDDLDNLNSRVSPAQTVLNPSFEVDSDADGVPDNWTRTLYPGGSGGFETASPAHGGQAYKFTHPGGAGNGGGELLSGYVEISDLRTYLLGYTLWASAAGMKNQVKVKYYDKGKAYLSEATLYISTSNPTSRTRYNSQFTPPSSARFFKVLVVGGYTDTDVAGTAYFDDITFREVPADNSITGAMISKTVVSGGAANIGSGATWLPTVAGVRQLSGDVGDLTLLKLQFYISGGWTASGPPSGLVMFDTNNQRVKNDDSVQRTVYYQTI